LPQQFKTQNSKLKIQNCGLPQQFKTQNSKLKIQNYGLPQQFKTQNSKFKIQIMISDKAYIAPGANIGLTVGGYGVLAIA
jgi:hypothetical protein